MAFLQEGTDLQPDTQCGKWIRYNSVYLLHKHNVTNTAKELLNPENQDPESPYTLLHWALDHWWQRSVQCILHLYTTVYILSVLCACTWCIPIQREVSVEVVNDSITVPAGLTVLGYDVSVSG